MKGNEELERSWRRIRADVSVSHFEEAECAVNEIAERARSVLLYSVPAVYISFAGECAETLTLFRKDVACLSDDTSAYGLRTKEEE